jgi:MFS family permease
MPKFSFKPASHWGVVAISFVTIALAYGLNFSFSVFFVAILEEFKWSRASIAGAFSLSSLILGISSWPGGRLVDRFGPRKIMMVGAIILSLATMASTLIREVWHLYFLFGILSGLGICGLGWVPNSVLLSNWFVKNRGSMVGIAFSGMGIGILAVGPSAQYLISSLGWRTAYLVFGLAVLVLLLPLSFFLQDRPNRKMENEGPDQQRPLAKAEDSREKGDWTLRRSMKTLPFWALFISFFLIPLGIFPVAIHQVAYIIDQGYSKILAALVFGTMGLLSTVGRPLFGVLSDRIGREKAVTWSFISSIAGILILIFLPALKSVFWLYLYAILFGLGFGARGPIVSAMMADMFSGNHFGSIYGFINIGNGIGGALGPWLGGLLYDLTGSYRIPFFICIPALVLACILFWIAGRARSNLHPKAI